MNLKARLRDMRRCQRAIAIGAIAAGVSACTARPPISANAHEQLHSVLWMQSSSEYRGLALQTYRQAEAMLDAALAEPSWTAAVEQNGDFESLPPAVILDVDETVLDNSAYQARLILQGEAYSTETWNDWCRERAAPAIPGAVSFVRYARQRGVTVFYVTNRRHVVEEDTRVNLQRVGFSMSGDVDHLLTRGERDQWAASDKTPRRHFIAQDYRIVLLIGDNFGDFLGGIDRSVAERLELSLAHESKWGRQWIVLPNPLYGSWENALIVGDGVSDEERLRQKRRSLER